MINRWESSAVLDQGNDEHGLRIIVSMINLVCLLRMFSIWLLEHDAYGGCKYVCWYGHKIPTFINENQDVNNKWPTKIIKVEEVISCKITHIH